MLDGNEVAVADFTKVIELRPKDPEAFAWRADAYFLADEPDYERALADYSQAIALDRRSGRFQARGLVYQDMDKHESAIADFDRALEFDPKNAYAYEARGLSHKALGKPEQAVADLEKALALKPDMESAKKMLAALRGADSAAEADPKGGASEKKETKAARSHDVEITFWNSVKDSDDKAMLEAYLKRFPDGEFAPLAKIKLERLE